MSEGRESSHRDSHVLAVISICRRQACQGRGCEQLRNLRVVVGSQQGVAHGTNVGRCGSDMRDDRLGRPWPETLDDSKSGDIGPLSRPTGADNRVDHGGVEFARKELVGRMVMPPVITSDAKSAGARPRRSSSIRMA